MTNSHDPSRCAANATAKPSAPAPAQSAVPTQTRGHFYARKNGGGLRTARKPFNCQQFACFRKIEPGDVYFDTLEPTQWPATKRICAHCAEEPV